MATYRLDSATDRPGEPTRPTGLGSAALIENARWYTHVRWIAAGIFLLLGALVLLPLDGEGLFGATLHPRPLFVLAAVLAGGNLPFWIAVRRISDNAPHRLVTALLWGEIALDLLVVTYLVHVAGALQGVAAFVYLLHITLACITLSRSESLAVALACALLYLGSRGLELAGLWQSTPVISQPLPLANPSPRLELLSAAATVTLWFAIWYFIGTLSIALRSREHELRGMNERLRSADEEKNRLMRRTTHDLKNPVFGIESNAQLLDEQAGASLLPASRRALDRLLELSASLRSRIDTLLLYDEVHSAGRRRGAARSWSALDLVLEVARSEVAARAAAREVRFEQSGPAVTVWGERRELEVIFTNLLSNAVTYSHRGGEVRLRTEAGERSARVSIGDDGIGIREEALPHIFEEYFQTSEAARANRSSSGLGLAIVREIAQQGGIIIEVESEQNRGTTFTVTLERYRSEGTESV